MLTPKSVIQLTAFTAFETGRKLNSVCCNYVHFCQKPLISVAQKRSFPKSTDIPRKHSSKHFEGHLLIQDWKDLLAFCAFFFFLLLVPLQTYIWQKKIWTLLIDLLKEKNNILHYCVHSEENDRQIKRVE